MASIQKRTLQDGSTRWLLQVKKKGYKPFNKNFGTKAAAEKLGRKVETDMENGVWDELAVEIRKKGETTLKHFIEKYIAEVSPLKKGGEKTIVNERATLNQVLKHKASSIDVYRLKKGDIIKLRDDWVAAGNKEATINRKLTTLQDVFNQIQTRWKLETVKNPVIGTKLKVPNGRRSRTFNSKELSAIRDALTKCQSPYIGWAFELALETACRRREILENEWSNINFEEGHLFVPAPLAKTRKDRYIPLTNTAIDILRSMFEYKQSQDHKPNDLFPLTEKSFEEAWKKTVKRSGIKNIQFRDTRHIALTSLSKIYPRAQDLARISGHDKLDTLLIYYEEDIHEQVTTMRSHEQANK